MKLTKKRGMPNPKAFPAEGRARRNSLPMIPIRSTCAEIPPAIAASPNRIPEAMAKPNKKLLQIFGSNGKSAARREQVGGD